MSLMPEFIGFSSNYATQLLDTLGVIPEINYQPIPPTGTTPGIILAQTPAAGQPISGTVTLTLTGDRVLPGVGTVCFSQPAVLTGNDDNP